MIRHARPTDIADILEIARTCGLFTSDDMEFFEADIRGFFDAAENEREWWVDEDEGALVAAAYLSPEMADRVWNLLFIAVAPEAKGTGRGSAMLLHVERELTQRGQRMLVIDTSSLPSFEATRGFYTSHGYTLVAQIPDFWTDGDDKVVFSKRLPTG